MENQRYPSLLQTEILICAGILEQSMESILGLLKSLKIRALLYFPPVNLINKKASSFLPALSSKGTPVG
jgi:hypothetical protein